MYGRILLFCLRAGGVGSREWTAAPIGSEAIRRERSSIRMLETPLGELVWARAETATDSIT